MRWLLLVTACLAGLSQPALAHPIHTTYTEIITSPGGSTARIRAFADDLSAAVARFHRRATPRDSSVGAAELARYVAAYFEASDAHGRRVGFTPCGIERAGVLTYVCLRLPPTAGLRLRNRLLSDLHADQVNIVQHRQGRTLLFTANGPAQPLSR